MLKSLILRSQIIIIFFLEINKELCHYIFINSNEFEEILKIFDDINNTKQKLNELLNKLSKKVETNLINNKRKRDNIDDILEKEMEKKNK